MNFLLIAAFIGASVDSFPPSTWFQSFSTPQPAEVIGNPLDYCGARIGLDVRDVELPRGWEGGYRFACRFPVIDYVSNRPLFMNEWTEKNATEIILVQGEEGLGALRPCLNILRGVEGFSKKNERARTKEVLEFLRMQESGTRAFSDRLFVSCFSFEYIAILYYLYSDYAAANYYIMKATRDLTSEDLEFFRSNPGWFLAPDGRSMPDLTGDVTTQFDFIEHARRLHFEDIYYASQILAEGIARYIDACRNFKIGDYLNDEFRATETFTFLGPFGLVIISGFGTDTIRRDAGLVINLGGNDVYLNNAGGAIEGAALVIDHSGNDTYDARDSSYTQGFGFLGVGYLIDLGGDDTYRAKHFSQGAGIMGVGAIWDRAGHDLYDAHAFCCQGAGIFGLGMILDDSGNDVYDCATLGQGAASTLGLGVLSDLQGNDTFRLAVTPGKDALGQSPGYGQGGALSFRHYPWNNTLTAYGGVGMLVNASGDDLYHTQGWCDQGGSYIMSLGVLYDGGGNDHYTAGTGQGSGIHITNAILVDASGDDLYEGGFRSGGSAGDRSTGFLIDYSGNDIYKSSTSCYGTGVKPFSYSLMIDYEGNDKYIASTPGGRITFNNWESFGGVWPESEPNL